MIDTAVFVMLLMPPPLRILVYPALAISAILITFGIWELLRPMCGGRGAIVAMIGIFVVCVVLVRAL